MADSSSMFPLEHWDLAPGEEVSQSPPIRAFHGSRILPCPAPTLDTEEFDVHHISCEDGSSMDSMAEFDLAPGEARSQGLYLGFRDSGFPPCPPATLDTEDFENNYIESEDALIVEDSLACWDLAPGEPRSQGPILDPCNTPKQFNPPPSLDTQEFENVWVVEDSLACWESARGEAGSERPPEGLNESHLVPSLTLNVAGRLIGDRKQDLPLLSISAPLHCINEARNRTDAEIPLSTEYARKRSLPPTSPQDDSREKPAWQEKLDLGDKFSGECCSPLAVQCGGTSSPDSPDGHGTVSFSGVTANAREHNEEFAERKNFGQVLLSPPKQAHNAAGIRSLTLTQGVTNNHENILGRTLRKCALLDVTNSRVSETRYPSKHYSNECVGGMSTNESTDCCRNSSSKGSFLAKVEDGLKNHDAVMPSVNRTDVSIDRVEYFSDSGNMSKSTEGVKYTSGTEMDFRSLGQKTGWVDQAKAKVRTLLDDQSGSIRKKGHYGRGRILEGWQSPRDGKKFVPTSKQLSLDRWLT